MSLLGSEYKDLYKDYYKPGAGSLERKRKLSAESTIEHIKAVSNNAQWKSFLDVGAGNGAVLARVDNGGIGGATIVKIDAEIPRILGTWRLALLVLSVAVNDTSLKRRSSNTVAAFAEGVRLTIGRLKLYADRIALTSIPPIEHGLPLERGLPLSIGYFKKYIIRKFNEIPRATATAHDLSFIDLATPMQNADDSLLAGISIDGVHLNPSGYDLWKSILMPGIERAIR